MKKILLSLLFLISACAKDNRIVKYDNPTNSSGNTSQFNSKSWNINQLPIRIYVPQELNIYKIAIQNASLSWQNALNRPVFDFLFNQPNAPNTQWTGPLDSLYDNYFGLFEMLNWNFTNIDNSVLAFTGTLTQSGQILHSDILFNFKNYRFGDVDIDPSDISLIDYESVLTHELGHMLGLDHIDSSKDPVSIMNPTIRKGQAKRILSQADIYRIKTLYNIQN